MIVDEVALVGALEGEVAPPGQIQRLCRPQDRRPVHRPLDGIVDLEAVLEVVEQLRGLCGPTQVEGAKIGMAQNIGGSGATILTHILKT